MLTRLIFALLLVLPVPAAAQAPAVAERPAASATATFSRMLAGSWALRVEGTVVFRFDLASDGIGWSGTWVRPRSFVTDGASFDSLLGPPVEHESQSGRTIGEWAELTFGDSRPGALPDVFRFHLVSLDRAELIYTDTGLAPFVLERIDPDTPTGPWVAGRVYRLPGVRPGMAVRFNVAPAVPPDVAPRPAPTDTQRPPAIIGR